MVNESVSVSGRTAYRDAVSRALDPAPTEWDPARATVVVLPFLDEVAERNAESAALAVRASEHALDRFSRCGFQLRSLEDARKAAAAAGLDLADPVGRSKAAVRAVGEAAGADIIVTGSVLLSQGGPHWMVKTEIKVLDVRRGEYVHIAGGSAQSTLPPGMPRKRKREQAVAHAVSNGLNALLAPYEAKKR